MAVYIIPGIKSPSWQLVAVVMGIKTMQSGKKRRKIAKINSKSKENFALSARIIFWLPSFLKFFPSMVHIQNHSAGTWAYVHIQGLPSIALISVSFVSTSNNLKEAPT